MIKKIHDIRKTKKIIEECIELFSLNLSGMRVLTEAASGYFAVTPLISALAGADQTYVVCKNTGYGTIEEVISYLNALAAEMGIPESRILYVNDKNDVANTVNVVTNSGFVRPIDEEFIRRLPFDAGVSLMFESWEFREADIDRKACFSHNIPIMGVDENKGELHIFKYVGLTALKLLMEKNIEIYHSKILLISSGGYLEEIKRVLADNGAELRIQDTDEENVRDLRSDVEWSEAVVIAEQKNDYCLIGKESSYIKSDWLRNQCPQIIHVAGVIDYEELDHLEISKYPDKRVPYGYMTVTTDYMGVRPVVELNTAGLRVGQCLVEGMRKFDNFKDAQEYAYENGPAMKFAMGENE